MPANELNQRQQQPKFSVAISTKGYQTLILNTLGDPEHAKRFTASITAAVANNPALQACDPATILAGALLGESLNLSPSGQLGQYYLIPFKNKKKGTTDATFVLGYKGYVQLAMRSGYYLDLDVMEVREGEYLGKDPCTGKAKFRFIEDDAEREKLPVVGYMAYFEYMNGFRKTLYWSKEKMLNHADQYSPAFSKANYEKYIAGKVPEKEQWKYSSFWYKDFDSMAKKTMLRQLISKWGVMSTEMVSGYEHDNSSVQLNEDGFFVNEDEYIVEDEKAIEEAGSPASEEPAETDEVPPFESSEDAENISLDEL